MDDQRKKIEQTTFEILQKYNDSKDSWVDIVKIARNMGFTVCEADFNDETESFVVSDKDKINFSGIYANKMAWTLIGFKACFQHLPECRD